jgi:hypothetical protein
LGEIPQEFQQLQTRSTIVDDDGAKLFDEYKHKNSIYEGIVKKTDGVTKQSMYMSFRRVSDEATSPNAFIHPGFRRGDFLQNTLSKFDLPSEAQRQIDIELSKLGF